MRPWIVLFLLVGSTIGRVQASSLNGTVSIKGRIEKVRLNKVKKFNPYGDAYQSKSDKPDVELPQQLIVYIDGLRAVNTKAAPARLGQKDKNFSASIVPVLAGDSVQISNDDTVRHHIRSNAKPWDFNLRPRAPGESVTRKFEAEGTSLGVVPVYCDIHSNMRAHVLVMPNPYFQLLPETGGHYSLKGLPAGTYTLTAWHPTLKAQPQKVTLKAGQAKKVDLVLVGKLD